MTTLPSLLEKLPSRATKRRVVRRKSFRLINTLVPPDEPNENQRLAESLKGQKPNPYNDLILANIKAARDAEKQNALDEGLPWE